MDLEIRTFLPGDEAKQAAIYNALADKMPGFKPSAVEEIRRRGKDPDFEASLRFVAVAKGQTIGYCNAQKNGRIGFPWCLPGHSAEEPLLDAALAACEAIGIKKVFTAYRGDWVRVTQFFEAHGFKKTREMVNYFQNLLDLPTMVIRRGLNISALRKEDVPTVAAMVPGLINLPPAQLVNHWFANPYFAADSLFVFRRSDETPQGVGMLISKPEYADPLKIDPNAPCFRLGAFGSEGRTTKRVNGLFSFLVREDSDSTAVALDLLSFALNRIQDDSVEVLAAQAPSDVRHLTGFYQKYFRKQGGFPIFERELA